MKPGFLVFFLICALFIFLVLPGCERFPKEPAETTQTPEVSTEESLKGPLVLDFYADWCGACEKMEPVVEKLKGEHKDVAFKKYDIDTSEGKKMADKFGVSAIPTFIFIDESGSVLSKRVGVISEAEFIKEIEKLARPT